MTTLKENSFPGLPPLLHAERLTVKAQMCQTFKRPTAAIFDLDNCLSDDKHRHSMINHAHEGDERYDSYHRMCFADEPAHGNVAVVLDHIARGEHVFFCTARPEKVRAVTMWWLRRLPLLGDIQAHRLMMRRNGDRRASWQVKEDAVKTLLCQGYDISQAYDDRPDIVDMYRRNGIDGVVMKIHNFDDLEVPTRGVCVEGWPKQGAAPKQAAQKQAAQPEHPEHPVLRRLHEAAQTFKERNSSYGNNNETFGKSFLLLFPGAKLPDVASVDDMNRLQVMIQLHNKLMRYAANFSSGGHVDSARDAIVYSAMLENFTS